MLAVVNALSKQPARRSHSISPVNSFRVVFNAYFGTDLELLPDRMFAHTSQQQFYDFFEITDRLH